MAHSRANKAGVAAGDMLAVTHPGSGVANVELQVVGAFTGTIGLEVSQDGGATFDSRQVTKADETKVASLAAPGIGRAQVGGNRLETIIRAKVLTLTAGAPALYLVAAGE